MEVVKMFTSIAGEEMFVGECHPARARILVKKELASWKDGKIFLHVLSVHDALLKNNPDATRGPLDDENVSKQEMERRLAWFRSFMTKASKVLAKMARPLPPLDEARAWAAEQEKKDDETFLEDLKLSDDPQNCLQIRFKSHSSRPLIFRIPEPDGLLTDAEADAYFAEDGAEILRQPASQDDVAASEMDAFLIEHGLGVLWKSALDKSEIFNVPATFVGPQVTKTEYDKLRARDRTLFRKEYRRKYYTENPPKVVAELVQVRYLWSLAD